MSNLELTTLDKYGTHQIKVSEIYNGNISASSKTKAAMLFENKAGDEEGATEGKIHIGDFVNYNPIADEDTGTESKYKYQSSNDYTGVTEAIVANQLTGFTDSSQNFTVKADINWQVIGIDGNNIIITSEEPILPDNYVSYRVMIGPKQYSNFSGYVLYGAKGVMNVSPNFGERNEINNISQIYKYGKGSDSSKARGMTIDDVNRIAGVIANEDDIIPSGVYVDSNTNGIPFGTELNDFKKGEVGGWTPEAWLDSNIDKSSDANAPGVNDRVTGYRYLSSNKNLMTANSTIKNKLIFGNNCNKNYWLASRGMYANDVCAQYGPGCVWSGLVSSYNGGNTCLFSSNKNERKLAFGIRPVLYLDSNVSLTSAGTTESVTTWNID